MTVAAPRIVPFGESAFLVELGSEVDPVLNARVHGLVRRLDGGAHGLEGVGRCVPAYASLLVPFDPAVAEAAQVAGMIAEVAAEVGQVGLDEPARAVEIPVCYGYDDGPDLEELAATTGLSRDAIIDQHAAASYRVYMLGFAPGFAYLGPLPEPLRVPRRAEPRVRVPAGSVAIAGAQTAVYPHETAGGWHIIGRTDERLWDPSAAEPARLRPGDLVRFVPA